MASFEPAVEPILAKFRHDPTSLLQILRETQEELDWISPETHTFIASRLGIPRTQVEALTQFYAHLYDHNRGRYRILFSDNITDRMAGSVALFDRLRAFWGVAPGETSSDGLVSIDMTPCTGLCDHGAALLVNNIAIGRLDNERIDRIARLIMARKPLADWPAELFAIDDNICRKVTLLGVPYVPGSGLDAAIRLGRSGIFDEIKSSRLRGRGGAGFPTPTKIEGARNAAGKEKYVVCNADEGEPGTFKDRVLLTSFLPRVLEGMAIAGFAAGATKGFVYLRGEYQYLRPHLQRTIDDMRASNLLGVSIRGAPGFDFDIQIHMGARLYLRRRHGADQFARRQGRPSARKTAVHGHPGL